MLKVINCTLNLCSLLYVNYTAIKLLKYSVKIISRVAGPEEGTYGREAALQRPWQRAGAPKLLWQHRERLGSIAHPFHSGRTSWAWTIKPRSQRREKTGTRAWPAAGHADSKRAPWWPAAAAGPGSPPLLAASSLSSRLPKTPFPWIPARPLPRPWQHVDQHLVASEGLQAQQR